MAHKAGFVNIIGSPNVGKSTLMNALVGERISIITSKAQTTRHRILGIVNAPDFQIVYSDTPGIIKPAYKMQEGMMGFVKTALKDADIMLFVTDVFEKEFLDDKTMRALQNTELPLLVLINKIDLKKDDLLELSKAYWSKQLPGAEVMEISALKMVNTEAVFKRILDVLPESPEYYPKDQLTDKPERFFVEEIIREKILKNYHKEIPYSCEIVVESFKESDDIIRIAAEIYVARESQKGILIGHQGKKLKKVGTQARADMETFFDKQVFLETFVKVKKNWRDDERQLKNFGYL